MTGFKLFVLFDLALIATFMHWLICRRPGGSDAPPPEAKACVDRAARAPATQPQRPRARRPQRAPDLNVFAGKVWVIDGDTIDVGRARVRLFGMDAPEMDQRGGLAAKSHLIRMAGGRRVSVEPVAVDCYGRIVGRVRLGAADLSEAMVCDGFAVAMRRYHADYIAAEEEARRAHRGLWKTDAVNGIRDPARHRRDKAARDGTLGRGNVLAFSRRPTR